MARALKGKTEFSAFGDKVMANKARQALMLRAASTRLNATIARNEALKSNATRKARAKLLRSLGYSRTEFARPRDEYGQFSDTEDTNPEKMRLAYQRYRERRGSRRPMGSAEYQMLLPR